jgi:hypothetical protein
VIDKEEWNLYWAYWNMVHLFASTVEVEGRGDEEG